MNTHRTDTHNELNKQTGKLIWKELERYFARGVLIKIHPSLDLVNVAAEFQLDNSITIKQWLNEKKIAHVQTKDALLWSSTNPTFWSIVVAPWVLIQLSQ